MSQMQISEASKAVVMGLGKGFGLYSARLGRDGSTVVVKPQVVPSAKQAEFIVRVAQLRAQGVPVGVEGKPPVVAAFKAAVLGIKASPASPSKPAKPARAPRGGKGKPAADAAQSSEDAQAEAYTDQ